MRKFFKNLLFFVTAHLLVFSSVDALLPWHFFLKKNITIGDSVVKIGDVGNIYSTEMTSRQKNDLAETVISDSPFSDADWNADFIRSLLDKKFIYPESIRGSSVHLTIPSKQFTIEEIANAIESAYLSAPKTSSGASNDGMFSNEFKVFVKNSISIPQNAIFKIEVDGKRSPGNKMATFLVSYVSGQKNVNSVKIPYILMKNYSMITAAANIDAGERLTGNNIKRISIWMDHPVEDVFREIPIGYISARKIEKGSMIMPSDALKKIDVKSGDLVTMEYVGKNLSIQSSVRACESGSIGQIIKFRTKLNKVIYGEVLSRDKAGFANKPI